MNHFCSEVIIQRLVSPPQTLLFRFRCAGLDSDFPGDKKKMKRTDMLFGLTFLFSLILLAVNAWGAPYISFNSIRAGETGIYIGIDMIDTNGKNLRNLTNHPTSDCCAAWAPDGRSFPFASNRDGKSEIYIIVNPVIIHFYNIINRSLSIVLAYPLDVGEILLNRVQL